MPSRIFVDDHGIEWTVLAVEPTWTERRSGRQRRIVSLDDEESAQFERLRGDRRAGDDRRREHPGSIPRGKIAGALEGGWLAFEGAGERRRLAPVPPGWFNASDAELVELLARARVRDGAPPAQREVRSPGLPTESRPRD